MKILFIHFFVYAQDKTGINSIGMLIRKVLFLTFIIICTLLTLAFGLSWFLNRKRLLLYSQYLAQRMGIRIDILGKVSRKRVLSTLANSSLIVAVCF